MPSKDAKDPNVNPVESPTAGATAWAAGSAAYAAAVGAGVGGATGDVLAAALAPAVAAVAQLALREWGERRLERASWMLQQSAELAGVEVEDVAKAMRERSQFQALAGEALVAASESALDVKVRALARAVAVGYNDDAVVDVERLYVDALSDMEVPHVRVLDFMARNRIYEGQLVNHELHVVAKAMPGYTPDVVHAIIGTFERHGLVFQRPVDYAAILRAADARTDAERHDSNSWLDIPPPGWHLSNLGLEVHGYLQGSAGIQAQGGDQVPGN